MFGNLRHRRADARPFMAERMAAAASQQSRPSSATTESERDRRSRLLILGFIAASLAFLCISGVVCYTGIKIIAFVLKVVTRSHGDVIWLDPPLAEANPAIHKWLVENELVHLSSHLSKVPNLPRLAASFEEDPQHNGWIGTSELLKTSEEISSADRERIRSAAGALKSRLVLEKWLKKHKWRFVYDELLRVGVNSLTDLANYAENEDSKLEMLSRFQGNVANLMGAKQGLPRSEEIPILEKTMFKQIVYESDRADLDRRKEDEKIEEEAAKWQARAITLLIIGTFFYVFHVWLGGLTPGDLYRGVPLHKCRTTVHQLDPRCATSKTLRVSVRTLGGKPVDLCQEVCSRREFSQALVATVDHVGSGRRIEATLSHQCSSSSQESESGEDKRTGEIDVIFSGQAAGLYSVRLEHEGNLLRGFPVRVILKPCDAHPSKTTVIGLQSKTVVVNTAADCQTTLRLAPKDEYGNPVGPQVYSSLADRFSIGLWKRVDKQTKRDELAVDGSQLNFVVYHGHDDNLLVSVSFTPGQEGWYTAQINLDGQPILYGKDLTLIVLSSAQNHEVREKLMDLSSAGYFLEAELLPSTGKDGEGIIDKKSTGKKVYIHLTPRQLTVKEYFMKIIPRRLFTYRVVPATKIDLDSHHFNNGYPIITLDDGFQTPKPRLVVKEALILVSTYHSTLLSRIGGSDTLESKREFFAKQLLAHHAKRNYNHTGLGITISRTPSVAESTYQATKWFNAADWTRKFEVKFNGEEGLDYGGVRREWFELLCKEIFHPSFGLFVQAEEGSEAVHPNPRPQVNKKMYKFAGKVLGKCLSEPAYGETYRLLMPVRLTKSFLAQLVGLRVHYKHFASDCPEYYSSKVKYLLENSLDDELMDEMTFSEEEYGDDNTVHVVDLKPGGRHIRVTDANKMAYLDALAQYKLANRYRDQTDIFLEGLHSVVPDTLLSLFDESELELMLCGVREYDLEDWRKNHTVTGSVSWRTIEWFWIAMSNFTSEQRAKTLQFSTGSSQLPPGGFAELKPLFQIGYHSPNSLPSAHTCFNMICLSEHSTYDKFEQSLLTAITEGCEGFGLI